MPTDNMPDNWQPPAPAWESAWSDTEDPLVVGYFGIQSDNAGPLGEWIAAVTDGSHKPFSVEQGSYVDVRGVTNYLYVCYWRKSKYLQWWNSHRHWWASHERLNDGVGYWREIIVMPFERLETLHSTQNPHGVGVSADSMVGPIREHGYPGAARDRIKLSKSDSLASNTSIETRLQAQRLDNGQRVLVTPPEKMCVIRSGQNWSYCEPQEQAYYLENVHPVLLEGMRFLRDHPATTGCYALRFVDCKDQTWGALNQSFGLGYATDIYVFEQWAKSHPTHLAIFDSFMQMVETFGEAMQLQLWHEVSVLPEDDCEFEYIACHADTGLLGYC